MFVLSVPPTSVTTESNSMKRRKRIRRTHALHSQRASLSILAHAHSPHPPDPTQKQHLLEGKVYYESDLYKEPSNFTPPGLEPAETLCEEAQPEPEDMNGQFAPEAEEFSSDSNSTVDTDDFAYDRKYSRDDYFEELVASFYKDGCMLQFRQMLDTYSDELPPLAAPLPAIRFTNEIFGHGVEEATDDNILEYCSNQQRSALDEYIMKFAHGHCDRYGTPADIDIFQILEETENGWTHNEISIAIQLLLLKGELLHVEENGCLLVFPASEKHMLKQTDSTTDKKWTTRVLDRVYDIFAQGKDLTFASIFSRMGLSCTEREVHWAIDEWIAIGVVTNTGDCYNMPHVM